MHKTIFFLFIGFASLFTACSQTPVPKEADVAIVTEYGKIYLQLFDETPKHKANFLKLCKEGFYDSTTFHRIVPNFMVQAGDPRYKDPSIKTDGPGYNLDAEIKDKYLHTRGMVSAARFGDDVNPDRMSSGSQFFIVTGALVDDDSLSKFENIISYAQGKNAFYHSQRFQELQKKGFEWKQNNELDSLKVLANQMKKAFDDFVENEHSPAFMYTDEQREVYKKVGKGAPYLDMQYTIFARVVGGMEVVDKIEHLQTKDEKPLEEVRIKKMEILKK